MAQVQPSASRFRPSTPPARLTLPVPVLSPGRIAQSNHPPASFKSGQTNLDTFSPVNQNGSFEFDRVLKSGRVHRRVKKKGAWRPSWKDAFLVLRPNLLSIYQSSDETGLRDSITVSEITAVATVKKTHTENVFGVFSPAKNYHFQGLSEQDTRDWIEKIRSETRTEIQEDFVLPSPRLPLEQAYDTTSGEEDAIRPDSSDARPHPQPGENTRSRASTTQRRTSHVNEYSGNEFTSHSDFSDAAGSVPKSMAGSVPKPWTLTPIASGQNLRPSMGRNASQMGGFDVNSDPERVIRQGWVQTLRTKGGVKSWKSLWVVLRPKTLTFYKDEDEYVAVKVIRMSSIINAADVDPLSKSKRFCFQVIVEDRAYQLCAPDEEELAKWLGALASVLAKRPDASKQITEGTAAMSVR